MGEIRQIAAVLLSVTVNLLTLISFRTDFKMYSVVIERERERTGKQEQ